MGPWSSGKGPRWRSCGFEDKLPDFAVLLSADPGDGVKSEFCLLTFLHNDVSRDARLAVYHTLPHAVTSSCVSRQTDPSGGSPCEELVQVHVQHPFPIPSSRPSSSTPP